MAGYTKLFNSILDSTIWQEPNETRLLWITMLAMSDSNGEIQSSIPGLARRAGITLEECEKGLIVLSSPDAYSRTKDHEGRRITEVAGGWLLLNHGRYRALLSYEERKEYNRIKQAEHRAKVKASSKDVNDTSMTVNHNKQCQHITDSRVQTTEADTKNTPLTPQGGKREKSENLPTSPQAIRISELFHRRPSTRWSDKEIRSFKAIPREALEHLEIVCAYTEAERLKGEQGRHRRDLATFLNNFTGELDRARAKSVTPQKQNGMTAAEMGLS